MSGTAHIVISSELRPAVEAVATILSTAEIDVGFVHRIESQLLPEGYNGVMRVYLVGGEVHFARDEDV